jgi:hypothetical protein
MEIHMHSVINKIQTKLKIGLAENAPIILFMDCSSRQMQRWIWTWIPWQSPILFLMQPSKWLWRLHITSTLIWSIMFRMERHYLYPLSYSTTAFSQVLSRTNTNIRGTTMTSFLVRSDPFEDVFSRGPLVICWRCTIHAHYIGQRDKVYQSKWLIVNLMRGRESNSKRNALCSPALQNSHCTEHCCKNNRWPVNRPEP